MKKIIFGIMLTMVLATGCGIEICSDSSKKPKTEDFICLECVTQYFNDELVYRDKFTDVLYFNGRNSTTPIAKADGTFLTYTEWKSRQVIFNETEWKTCGLSLSCFIKNLPTKELLKGIYMFAMSFEKFRDSHISWNKNSLLRELYTERKTNNLLLEKNLKLKKRVERLEKELKCKTEKRKEYIIDDKKVIKN